MIISTIIDNIENKIENLRLQECFLKKQILFEVIYFAKNIYRTVAGTSGLYYIEDLKSDSHIPYIYVFICFNESPSKVMKNAFYFILKALFIL